MNIHMEPDEKALFAALLAKANDYAEFGAGGSTVMAASVVPGFVVSVDSSREWLSRVGEACAQGRAPTLVHADIGPTVEWGQPKDKSHRDRWPLYALAPWADTPAARADLFLVDGRFRVACFLEILLRCRDEAILVIHDFAPRAHYHVVREFADEVATASALAAFRRKPSLNHQALVSLLDQARYDPG